jgi:homoserine kinase
MPPTDVLTVRVPATSANLGPGFDSLALALDVWDEVSVQPATGSGTVEVTGEGASSVPRDESNLVLRAAHSAFAALRHPPIALRLSCRNAIPHGRGLGSSAAAICAGVLLAGAVTKAGGGPTADTTTALALASELEGHPDNVAACLLGGLTIAWTGRAGARAVKIDPLGVVPVLFVPAEESSTRHARALLPDTVGHGDASFNVARAALLVAALSGGQDTLLEATEDRLHQDYRAVAMPASAELMRRLRDRGVAAVISGAGPSVLALLRDDAQVASTSELCPPGWRQIVTAVSARGAHIVTGE